VLVFEAQRSRMLRSAVEVIAEHGYGQMSVARVAGGAGVSRRTFYDFFVDREDCFLAVFDDAVSVLRESVLTACEGQRGWVSQTRAGLLALLLFLDEQRAMGSLLIVDGLKAGAKVQEQRGRILAQLSRALHEAGSQANGARELPPLTGEGLVGAVFSVIHNRLQAKDHGPMVELLSPLMGMIVLPYLGPAAAQRELARPLPEHAAPREARRGAYEGALRDPLAKLQMRVTYRTLLVLNVIDERPGASNREIADAAGVSDQGQISKLLGRLERLGLIKNTGGVQPSGAPNQWHLTPKGQEAQQQTRRR
jgi:AcrR family transcriptional regulator/DNA-binding MarR family transcriptional regulator